MLFSFYCLFIFPSNKCHRQGKPERKRLKGANLHELPHKDFVKSGIKRLICGQSGLTARRLIQSAREKNNDKLQKFGRTLNQWTDKLVRHRPAFFVQ